MQGLSLPWVLHFSVERAGNLCSIFYKNFEGLVKLTGNYNKAVFLDKCIFWWQISTYTLADDKIWFTRSIKDMASELHLSERTIGRYLNELEGEGLIARVNKLRLKKRLYIRITDKLLVLLNQSKITTTATPLPEPESTAKSPESIFFQQDGIIEKDKLSVSIYKDKYNNSVTNNIVNEPNVVNFVEKQSPSFQKTTYAIEKEIGERVTDELKDRVKGMMYNLEHKQQVQLFDKERLFAEIIFSLTNPQQFKNIECMAHKINIIAKILIQKSWKTPKGFHKHWDIGQHFKEREEVNARKRQNKKLTEALFGVDCPQRIAEIKSRVATCLEEETRYQKAYTPEIKAQRQRNQKLQEKLATLNQDINYERRYLEETEDASKAGRSYATTGLIDSIARKIAKLYEQQAELQLKLEQDGALLEKCA